MALKDRLNDALQATPPENTARLQTLQAVLARAGGGSDAELQAAIAHTISEREQKAASFAAAGQTDMARAERAEIDALRGFLRLAAPPPASAPATKTAALKKEKKAAPATAAAAAEAPALLTRNQMILGGAALAAAALAVFFLLRPSHTGEGSIAGNTAIVLKADDRTLGNPKAPVVMLEYAAPTCPHCARFNATVMPKIKSEYIDKGKVFYIFRTFPLSAPDYAVEGIARACLPADKYFDFLDLMFRNQPKWDPDGYQIPDVGAAIKQIARIMGVSPEDADRCMTDKTALQHLDVSSREAVARYNIQGTPTFIINGSIVQTTEGTWPQLKAKFDTLLAKK